MILKKIIVLILLNFIKQNNSACVSKILTTTTLVGVSSTFQTIIPSILSTTPLSTTPEIIGKTTTVSINVSTTPAIIGTTTAIETTTVSVYVPTTPAIIGTTTAVQASSSLIISTIQSQISTTFMYSSAPITTTEQRLITSTAEIFPTTSEFFPIPTTNGLITTTTIIITTTTTAAPDYYVRFGIKRVLLPNGTYIYEKVYLQNMWKSDLPTTQPIVVTPPPSRIFDSFNVKFSDLSKMTVYSGTYINAIEFTYLNGSSQVYGNSNYPGITSAASISLENVLVRGINVISDNSFIYGIQFLLHDKLLQTERWTSEMGNELGMPYAINFQVSSYYGIFIDNALVFLQFSS